MRVRAGLSLPSALQRRRGPFVHGGVALLVSSLGDLVAGLLLGSLTHTLQMLPGLMVLVPAAVGMRGNIYGALGSRLGTYLHTGLLERGGGRATPLRQNVWATTCLSVVISAVLALYARWFSLAFGVDSIGWLEFFVISVVGGILSGFVILLFTVAMAAAARRRSWDMDSVAAPLVTAAGDMVTVPALYLATLLVGFRPVVVTLSGLLLLLTVVCFALGVRTRLPIFRRVFRESLPVLALAGVADVFAGLTLEVRLERFVAFPALLVLVPPFLEDAGALGGMLASRLSSGLHLGTVPPRPRPGREVRDDIVLTYIHAFLVFLLVGVSADLAAGWVGLPSPGLAHMVAISLLAGVLATTATVVTAYYAAIGTFRFGMDPDSHGVPAVTSSLDLFGTLSLVAAILILGPR